MSPKSDSYKESWQGAVINSINNNYNLITMAEITTNNYEFPNRYITGHDEQGNSIFTYEGQIQGSKIQTPNCPDPTLFAVSQLGFRTDSRCHGSPPSPPTSTTTPTPPTQATFTFTTPTVTLPVLSSALLTPPLRCTGPRPSTTT